jgi:hypothetical protein
MHQILQIHFHATGRHSRIHWGVFGHWKWSVDRFAWTNAKYYWGERGAVSFSRHTETDSQNGLRLELEWSEVRGLRNEEDESAGIGFSSSCVSRNQMPKSSIHCNAHIRRSASHGRGWFAFNRLLLEGNQWATLSMIESPMGTVVIRGRVMSQARGEPHNASWESGFLYSSNLWLIWKNSTN